MRTAALSQAYTTFVRLVETTVSVAGPATDLSGGRTSFVDTYWDGHLRAVTGIALAHLDAADADEGRQLRQLADAVADLAMMSDAAYGPSAAPAQSTMDDLRLRIERLVIGSAEALPRTTELGESLQPASRPEPVAPSPLPADEPTRKTPAADKVSPPQAEPVVDDPDPDDDGFGPDPTQTGEWAGATVFLARPRLATARRRGRAHDLGWLPDTPQVNDEPFDLYVDSPVPASQAATEGMVSPHLFLVGHLDRERRASAHLLRLRIGSRGAIDVTASGVTPPPELDRLMDRNDAYVVPAAWLDRCLLLTDDDDATGVPAMLYSAGAEHGVDGLPEAVCWWAGWGVRVVYAILPEPQKPVQSWLRLHRRRPSAQSGRLVELRLGRRGAIDVAKTTARLESLRSVRTILPQLRAAGVELVLPRAAFEHVRVTRIFANEGQDWRAESTPRRATLASLATFSPTTGARVASAGPQFPAVAGESPRLAEGQLIDGVLRGRTANSRS